MERLQGQRSELKPKSRKRSRTSARVDRSANQSSGAASPSPILRLAPGWLYLDAVHFSIRHPLIAGVIAISGRQPARLAHPRCRGARRTREHHASTVAQRSLGSHLPPQPLLLSPLQTGSLVSAVQRWDSCNTHKHTHASSPAWLQLPRCKRFK